MFLERRERRIRDKSTGVRAMEEGVVASNVQIWSNRGYLGATVSAASFERRLLVAERMSSAFNEPILNATTLIAAKCRGRGRSRDGKSQSRDRRLDAHQIARYRAARACALQISRFVSADSAYRARGRAGLWLTCRCTLKRPRGRDMAALNFRYTHARAKDNTSAVASVSGSRRFAAKLGAIARSRSCSRILIRSLNSARDVCLLNVER